MQLTALQDSNLSELNARANCFIAACGYEARSSLLASRLDGRIGGRLALCFTEWADALSRKKNEDVFRSVGFGLKEISASNYGMLAQIILDAAGQAETKTPLAFDISSMNRAWHGTIIRTLKTANSKSSFETFFAYVPAKFSNPPRVNPAYEIVAPVEGFASLSPPDLPIAAIIGIGYEKDRALGLQQLLDPKRTILMIPRFRSRPDRFYAEVLRSNRDLLARTPRELQFEYWLDEPASTFGALASLVSKLLPSYRIVLASIGPKMLSILCFLVAVQFPQVSVWRASSGAQAIPREVYGDADHTIVLKTTWSPPQANE